MGDGAGSRAKVRSHEAPRGCQKPEFFPKTYGKLSEDFRGETAHGTHLSREAVHHGGYGYKLCPHNAWFSNLDPSLIRNTSWLNDFTFVCLNFLMCNMGMIIGLH